MIVLFLPNGIGDLLMALPSLRRMVDCYGEDRIAMVVANNQQGSFLRGLYKNLLIIERYDKQYFSQLRLWIKLFSMRPEIILCPMISKKMVNVLFFCLLNAKIALPLNVLRRKLFNLVPCNISLLSFGGHQVNYFVQFIAYFNDKIDKSLVDPLELQGFKGELISKKNGTSLATKDENFLGLKVAFGISCGLVERHKIPSVDFFAKLANTFLRYRIVEIYLIGNSQDLSLINEFINKLNNGILIKKLIDLPLSSVISTIAECDLGVAGTTGQGHMMAAAGLPMLVLSGVTDPYQSGPYSHRAAILEHKYLCGPCYQESFRFGCKKIKCMDTLNIETAIDLVDHLIFNSSYGKFWYKKENKRATVSVNEIKIIHRQPQEKWTL
jgi:ADP-heptose:LPS heptosyltransferase